MFFSLSQSMTGLRWTSMSRRSSSRPVRTGKRHFWWRASPRRWIFPTENHSTRSSQYTRANCHRRTVVQDIHHATPFPHQTMRTSEDLPSTTMIKGISAIPVDFKRFSTRNLSNIFQEITVRLKSPTLERQVDRLSALCLLGSILQI